MGTSSGLLPVFTLSFWQCATFRNNYFQLQVHNWNWNFRASLCHSLTGETLGYRPTLRKEIKLQTELKPGMERSVWVFTDGPEASVGLE
uniref:Uncharacterized protein n=1 Tax=Anguilla anguilla TaxID=7936 RepID=A0A0E9QC70_ANGAN